MDAPMRTKAVARTIRLLATKLNHHKNSGYSRWQCLHIIASKQQQPKHKCCHLHKGFISWKPISSLAEQFQAAAAAKRKTVNVQTVFRTQESDPTRHSLAQDGLYYTVSENEVKQLFQKGLPLHFARQAQTFQETCFMVRRPALEIIRYLKNLNLEHPSPKFLLYGRMGSGKTLSLAHIMHFCFRDNWLLVHAPWPHDWNRHYRETAPSPWKSGRIDLPMEAAEWLAHFRSQNARFLNDIKITQTYTWTKREVAEEGSPLQEIIEFGINRIKFASDCVGVILKEVRRQAATHKFKLLVVVDGVNAFWNQTNIKNPEKELLMADQISLVHNFKKMLQSDWTNGAIVCSVDVQAKLRIDKELETPYCILGKQGFEWLDPFVPVHVPNYSEKEAYSCIEYYHDRNWLQHKDAKTEEGKKELIFLSNKNPFQLLRVCSSK